MREANELATLFEANRTRLRAASYRMLGSIDDAEDAVQEAWLRLQRSDTSNVDNLAGWLMTVVSRVCLDALRSRRLRNETALELAPEPPARHGLGADPEADAVLADSVGTALLVVLDTLAPSERLSFVLHDMFAVSFADIATVLGRSEPAVRQLASRARRRVQGVSGADSGLVITRHRELVQAFLAASREGRFDALLELLDPDAVMSADPVVVAAGSPAKLRGAGAVAEMFLGRAKAARLALVDGFPGAVWMHAGQVRVVFEFSIVDDLVVAIDLLSDADTLAQLQLEMLVR